MYPKLVKPGKRSMDMLTWLRNLVESEEYQRSVELRLMTGVLGDTLEKLIWEHIMGVPVRRTEWTGKEGTPLFDVNNQSEAELKTRARKLAKVIEGYPDTG